MLALTVWLAVTAMVFLVGRRGARRRWPARTVGWHPPAAAGPYRSAPALPRLRHGAPTGAQLAALLGLMIAYAVIPIGLCGGPAAVNGTWICTGTALQFAAGLLLDGAPRRHVLSALLVWLGLAVICQTLAYEGWMHTHDHALRFAALVPLAQTPGALAVASATR